MELGELEREIKRVDFDKVNPAPYNPRKDLQPDDDDYQKLKKSIKHFGVVQVLVWNENTGNLVGGHQTLKILKNEFDRDSAKMSVVNLPLEEEKKLNLALNKVEGEWENQKLAQLLDSFDDDASLILAGFDEQEVDNLLAEIEAEQDLDFFSQVINETEEMEDTAQSDEHKDLRNRQHPKNDLDLGGLNTEHRARIKRKKADRAKNMAEQQTGEDYNDGSEPEYYSEFSLTVKMAQKETIIDTLNTIKEKYNLDTQLEAMLKLCEIYKQLKGDID